MPRRSPLVIAHRGASGYRPEHTLAAYGLAIEMGADYIEPDLVSTRDGVLVARHENEVSGTTDVAAHPEFASRRATKWIGGKRVTGWFTEDFTIEELKTLRARERIPDLRPANTAYDGLYEVPTLQEIINLVRRHEAASFGRRIGLYPETKHPAHFASIGLPLEQRLVDTLHAAGYADATAPVYLQSFEPSSLRRLAGLTRLPLVQLIDAAGAPADHSATSYAGMITPAGLANIAAYAAAIGVHKDLVYPRDAAGNIGAATSLARDAHAAGLEVHAWTFRAENTFLPAALRLGYPEGPGFARAHGDLANELRLFATAGVDAVFTDHADIAGAAFAR